MIKTFNKLGKDRHYFNIMNTIYEKPRAIMLNGEKLKSFPLISETRQGCPLLPLLFNTVMGFQQVKDNKLEKKEVKLSLFTNNMILYRKL